MQRSHWNVLAQWQCHRTRQTRAVSCWWRDQLQCVAKKTGAMGSGESKGWHTKNKEENFFSPSISYQLYFLFQGRKDTTFSHSLCSSWHSLQCNSMYIYTEVSLIILHGAYSQEVVYRIAAIMIAQHVAQLWLGTTATNMAPFHTTILGLNDMLQLLQKVADLKTPLPVPSNGLQSKMWDMTSLHREFPSSGQGSLHCNDITYTCFAKHQGEEEGSPCFDRDHVKGLEHMGRTMLKLDCRLTSGTEPLSFVMHI